MNTLNRILTDLVEERNCNAQGQQSSNEERQMNTLNRILTDLVEERKLLNESIISDKPGDARNANPGNNLIEEEESHSFILLEEDKGYSHKWKELKTKLDEYCNLLIKGGYVTGNRDFELKKLEAATALNEKIEEDEAGKHRNKYLSCQCITVGCS